MSDKYEKKLIELLALLEENPDLVKGIIAEGCEAARKIARETLEEVRQVMGLDY